MLPTALSESLFRVPTGAAPKKSCQICSLRRPDVQVLPCEHVVHSRCRLSWKHNKCPSCNQSIDRVVVLPVEDYEYNGQQVPGRQTRQPDRVGIWGQFESEFANALLQAYVDGLLPFRQKVRLRAVLSRMLHCAPGRITSKMNIRSYGKPAEHTSEPPMGSNGAIKALIRAEDLFLQDLAFQNGATYAASISYWIEVEWRAQFLAYAAEIRLKTESGEAFEDADEPSKSSSSYKRPRRLEPLIPPDAQQSKMVRFRSADVVFGPPLPPSSQPLVQTDTMPHQYQGSPHVVPQSQFPWSDSSRSSESLDALESEFDAEVFSNSSPSHTRTSTTLVVHENRLTEYDGEQTDSEQFQALWIADLQTGSLVRSTPVERNASTLLLRLLMNIPFDASDVWTAVQPMRFSNELNIVQVACATRVDPLREWCIYSGQFTFTLNQGVPGRVFARQTYETQENVSALAPADFPRVVGARRFSMRSCVAVPVVANGRPVVFAFYSLRHTEPSEQLINYIADCLSRCSIEISVQPCVL